MIGLKNILETFYGKIKKIFYIFIKVILLFLNNQLINALRIPSIIIIITRIRIQCNTLSIRVSSGAIYPSSLIIFFKIFILLLIFLTFTFYFS